MPTTSLGLPSVAAGASAEAQAAAFASDPRVHFSQVTKRWAFEDDDGNEFEYDGVKGVWVPVVRIITIHYTRDRLSNREDC